MGIHIKGIDMPPEGQGRILLVKGDGEVSDWFDLERKVIASADVPSADRWTPVSERLPEESGKYLITANDGIHKRTTVAKYQHRHKTWEMTGRMAYWKVLAWRPLPGPWKGEDNETD